MELVVDVTGLKKEVATTCSNDHDASGQEALRALAEVGNWSLISDPVALRDFQLRRRLPPSERPA